MVAEIFGGISALKAALDIAKSVKDMNDVAARQGAIIELREQILSAQEAQSSLIQEISALKTKLADFETWETEKQRYKLDVIAPGIFCYIIQETMRGREPVHRICANCYSAGKKGFLQQHITGPYHDRFVCHLCGETLNINKGEPPRSSARQSPYET